MNPPDVDIRRYISGTFQVVRMHWFPAPAIGTLGSFSFSLSRTSHRVERLFERRGIPWRGQNST